MKVFAVYLSILSFLLLFWPSIFLDLGFKDVSSPWVPTLGYVVGALAFYYFMAIRENAVNFYSWTTYARFPILFFFIALVSLGIAPPIMLLIGLIDTGCAIWTSLALKHEQQSNPAFQRNALKRAP